MSGETINVTINMDKPCAECGKGGASGSGLCMKCAVKALTGLRMKSEQGRKVQRVLNEKLKRGNP
jgi:hypothetical protein